jgi:predicted metal-binding membrane protein
MSQQASPSTDERPGLGGLVIGGWRLAAAVLAFSVAGWALLTWLAVDMGNPLFEWTMPDSSSWNAANMVSILLMWAVMMAAMMLPSALPMILAFGHLSARNGELARARVFVAAYLLVWIAFSIAATLLQWALQALDWVDPMIVSTSATLNGALLVIAGVYQFTPLKKMCLANCRTPFAFLLGEWQPGVAGAFRMGLRHGLFCMGCCWAVMALLFVGGVMNLAWIAALSIVVAIEKMAPRGEQLAAVLGIALIVAGAAKLVTLLAA